MLSEHNHTSLPPLQETKNSHADELINGANTDIKVTAARTTNKKGGGRETWEVPTGRQDMGSKGWLLLSKIKGGDLIIYLQAVVLILFVRK